MSFYCEVPVGALANISCIFHWQQNLQVLLLDATQNAVLSRQVVRLSAHPWLSGVYVNSVRRVLLGV